MFDSMPNYFLLLLFPLSRRKIFWMNIFSDASVLRLLLELELSDGVLHANTMKVPSGEATSHIPSKLPAFP